jgi:leucyl-tRNA synthetase
MQSARDWYREVTSPENGGTGLHADLVFHWLRMSALMVQPIIPHFSEFLWMDILEEQKSVQTALWPEAQSAGDESILVRLEYMRGVLSTMRSAEAAIAKKKGKGKTTGPFDPSKPKNGRIFVATSFPAWQRDVLDSIKQSWDASGGKAVDDKEVRELMAKKGLAKDKRAMPFMQQFKVSSRG